jgi:hypothetical protein
MTWIYSINFDDFELRSILNIQIAFQMMCWKCYYFVKNMNIIMSLTCFLKVSWLKLAEEISRYSTNFFIKSNKVIEI